MHEDCFTPALLRSGLPDWVLMPSTLLTLFAVLTVYTFFARSKAHEAIEPALTPPLKPAATVQQP
jgi:hypothetical protein